MDAGDAIRKFVWVLVWVHPQIRVTTKTSRVPTEGWQPLRLTGWFSLRRR